MKLGGDVANVLAGFTFSLDGINVRGGTVPRGKMALSEAKVKKLIADEVRNGAVWLIPLGVGSLNFNNVSVFSHISLETQTRERRRRNA
jgi:hypothetical protein